MVVRLIEESHTGSDTDPDRSRLAWYRESESGKRFFVLRQRGSFPEICRDHGVLLGSALETGVFPEIVDKMRVDTDAEFDALDIMLRALFFHFCRGIFDAASDEFRDGVRALYNGYRDSVPNPRYDWFEVMQACVAIDAGNLATGFARNLERAFSADAEIGDAIATIKQAVRHYRHVNPDDLDRMPKRSLVLALAGQVLRARLGMGCTGFALAPDLTAEGRGLHGRTFDGAFFAWNALPGIFLADERGPGRAERFRRYASVGTAGLVYSGGISGINDAGIACSLHQMSTRNYSTGRPGGGWEIAPYLQQRILREAVTLGDAIRIAKTTKHFASWAILVSDAANGQALRLEINGHDGARGGAPEVVASEPEPWVAQSNHFLSDAMREGLEDFGKADAHFTPTVGKWLETRTRLDRVEARLKPLVARRATALPDAIALLADHEDARLEGPGSARKETRRSFGRTICKSYGQMASIARAAPGGGPAELWFTIGDRLPGPHARFAGFTLDWSALEARLLDAGETRIAGTVPEGFVEGLGAYVEAFTVLARPRDANGRYLGRKLTDAEERTARDVAIGRLDAAVEAAENALGVPELPMRYIRARLLFENARFAEAERDCRLLVDLAGLFDPPVPMIDYERALIFILAAAVAKARKDRALAADLAARGRERLDRAKAEHFPDGPRHPGFGPWEEALRQIEDFVGTEATLPAIDFVTVE